MTREEKIKDEALRRYSIQHPFLEISKESFIEGAKWADKTMIDKACDWLKLNTNWDDEWDEMGRNIDYGMIEEFRKAMEG